MKLQGEPFSAAQYRKASPSGEGEVAFAKQMTEGMGSIHVVGSCCGHPYPQIPSVGLEADSSCCGARNSLFAIRSQNFVRVDTKHLRRTMFAQTQVSAQPLRSLASAAGGASLRPAATPFCSLLLPQAALANVPDGPISFVCPKETGERKRQQGEGFLPDALPLHPFLLTLRSVRPHIWAGCTRPPPLPWRILCTAFFKCRPKSPQSLLRPTAPLTSKGSHFSAVQFAK